MTTVLTKGGGTPARASRLTQSLMVLLLVASAACRAGGAARVHAPLTSTFESAEAVAAAMLDALAASDPARLRVLALSETEFADAVWPALPSSRPEVNLPLEYAWGTLQQNSRASLAMTVREHGGKTYRLQRVAMGTPTRYGAFIVHPDTSVVVREPGSGAERRLKLFGSLIEQEGRWKIFSYVVD